MSKLSREELHQIAETAADSDVCKKVSAKQYLSTIRRMENAIERKKVELKKLKTEAASISSMDYDVVRVQSSGNGGQMARSVATYVDLEQEIIDETTTLTQTRHTIINQIESMENQDYATLLFKRYVEHKRLELIAVEMGYSYSRTKHLHGYALLSFERQHPKAPDHMIE